MKKYNLGFLLFVSSLLIYSCTKDDGSSVEPARDYSDQYEKDIDSINKFIDNHKMVVDSDFNVTFSELEPGEESIRDGFDLDSVMVDNYDEDGDEFQYKVYYIKLREGVGNKPCSLDSVHVAYKGNLMDEDITQFDYAQHPTWFQLEDVVRGWGKIIPKFKTGTYDVSEGPNPVNFTSYGAGVMFLPSGLGYYGSATGTIASYSPLIFSFKLCELRYKDHDRDGILTKDEGDPDDPTVEFIDYDTDGDDVPNYYDVDDDGDHVLTKNETIQYVDPITGKKHHYSYNGAATDDPATPYDETQGVPRCYTGPVNASTGLPTAVPADFTDPNRLRRYLDPDCKPPYE